MGRSHTPAATTTDFNPPVELWWSADREYHHYNVAWNLEGIPGGDNQFEAGGGRAGYAKLANLEPSSNYRVLLQSCDRSFWGDSTCSAWSAYSRVSTLSLPPPPPPARRPGTHSGYLIQSSYGWQGNFELVVPTPAVSTTSGGTATRRGRRRSGTGPSSSRRPPSARTTRLCNLSPCR